MSVKGPKFIVICLLMVFGRVGFSQAPGTEKMKPTLPTGPLLRAAPEFSCWVINFIYPEDKKKGGSAAASPAPDSLNRPRQVVVTKTRKIVHEELTDIKGTKTDKWYAGATQYLKLAGQSAWFQSEDQKRDGAPVDPNYKPLPATGFRDCEGVTSENFAGTVDLGGQQILVFVPGGFKALDLSETGKQKEQLEKQPTIAYIDEEKRLPLAIKDPAATHLYEFREPPTAMQSLPPDLSAAIRKGEEARSRLLQPAPRPY